VGAANRMLHRETARRRTDMMCRSRCPFQMNSCALQGIGKAVSFQNWSVIMPSRLWSCTTQRTNGVERKAIKPVAVCRNAEAFVRSASRRTTSKSGIAVARAVQLKPRCERVWTLPRAKVVPATIRGYRGSIRPRRQGRR